MTEEEPLTAEEFQAWKDHRITCKVFSLLAQVRNEHAEGLALGGTLGRDSEQRTAKQVGIIEGIDKVLHMEVDDGEG